MFTSNDVCLRETTWEFWRANPSMPTGNWSLVPDVSSLLGNASLIQTRCAPGFYNELASLMQAPGHVSVKLLFSNGTYNMLSAGALIVFVLIYFVLAALSATLSVPAGMVIPSLIIGGSIGRMLGLAMNAVPGVEHVDPGSWAMIGAAAFWCGSARITVTIAVIIMEITGDFRYIPALAVAVMFARLAGNFLGTSLYHKMIHLKKFPFLEDIAAKELEGKEVAKIMVQHELVTLSVCPTWEEVDHVLRNTVHNGFPVVLGPGDPEHPRTHSQMFRLHGLVTREALVNMMRQERRAYYEMDLVMNETPVTVLPTFTVAQAFK